MNKTIAFIVFGVLVALTIAGYIVLAVLERNPSNFVTAAVTLLGLAAVAGGLQSGLQKIERQTNGTLSRLLARNQALEAEVAELRSRYTVDTGAAPAVPPADPQRYDSAT